MPQAAPQGQKTMDQALHEAIATHEEGQNEAPAIEEVEARPEGEQPAEASEGHEEQPTEAAEAKEPEAKQAKAPQKPAAKEGRPAAKPIPALSSWPPHLREQFHALPRAVKDQIIKSQGDYARGLAERDRQIGAAKQQAEAAKPLAEALAPFMPHLQSVGVAPAAAVRNLFQTEYVLRTGAEAQKAQVVANLMNAYGVTPASLVAVLKGTPAPDSEEQEQPKPQPRKQQEFRDPRFTAFEAHMLKLAQEQAAGKNAKDEAELNEFLNSGEAEFFDDVHKDMAAIAQTPSGKGLSYKQLYEKACLLNDDVRTVLEKRKADEASVLRSQQAQRARKAASSVKNEPGAPQGARKSSMWDDMRRAIEAHHGPQE